MPPVRVRKTQLVEQQAETIDRIQEQSIEDQVHSPVINFDESEADLIDDDSDVVSIARTQCEAFKPDKFNPKYIKFIGLSPRATDNPKVSYSIYNVHELNEVLRCDKEILDYKCTQFKQTVQPDRSSEIAQEELFEEVVKNNGRKGKGGMRKKNVKADTLTISQ